MVDFKITELDADVDFSNLPYWDVVIIGAGPAGLTTLIIEAKDAPGGQPQSCTPTSA